MAYEEREGSGCLFENEYKRPDNNKPDYTGKLMINGELVKLAAWRKQGKKGEFISLSVDTYKKENAPF